MSEAVDGLLEQSKQQSQFAYYFDELFDGVKASRDQFGEQSPEYEDACDQLTYFIYSFWKHQTTQQPQQSGSFGVDINGKDQQALCMQLLTPEETSICKWGLSMDTNGNSMATMELLVSPHNKPEIGQLVSDHVYNIEIKGGSVHIDRNNWYLKPGQLAKEEIIYPFNLNSK